MKKILLLFSLILAFFTNAQVNYSQDWTATGLSNWTTTSSVFSRIATAGQICGTTGGTIRGNRYSGNEGDFTSPNIPGNNQGLVTMSFDYKVTIWSAGTVATTLPNLGTIDVQYASNAGGPWTTAYTVNSTNHVVANTCATRTVTFSPNAGNLFVRFYVKSAASGDNYYYFDNVTMTQGAAPTCLAPSAITLVNVAATTANISWTAPTPAPVNGYDVYYNTTGVAPTGATILNATNSVQSTTNTATISALTPITTYYVWVRAKCAAGDMSTWTPMPAFMTLCVPVTVLPWTENFDAMTTLGAAILPPCWKNVTGTSAWTSSNAVSSTTSPGPRSTPNYVRIQYGNTNASQLWSPGFALTAGVTYEYSFYYHTGGTGSSQIGYTGNVLVNTSQSATGATNLGGFITATQGTSAYTQYKVYFTPTVSANYNFAVNVSSNFTPWYLGVDDFKLRVAPTCLDVQGLAITNTTTTSTTVQWTVPTPAPANGYDVYYTTNPATPLATVTPQFSGVAGPSQLIGGLTPSTTYYIWVRARCSATDIGDWTGPLQIYTNYCLPTGGSSSTTYYLNNITTTTGFTNIAYTATSYNAYVNNSAQSFSVLPGASVNVNLGATSGTHYFHAWIDWNNDLVLDPLTEIVYSSTSYQASAQFTISSVGRPSGSYRIRFAQSYIGAVTPCGPAAYGSYVDYTFIIRPCSVVAPTNVTVTGITQNAATVNWTASANNLVYRVYWRLAGDPTWPNSSPLINAPTTTYNITGLQPAKAYEVKVVAVCNTNEGTAPTVTFTTTCDPTPPNVVVSNITSTSALATWNPLVASANYEIRWRVVGTPGWFTPQPPGTPQPPQNSYLMQNLESFKTYEVQVRSICVGASTGNPWSNPQVFTTIRVCSIPPPGLTITQLNPTSAEVTWEPYTGTGATNSYILRYRKVGIPSWTTINVNNANTYTITGLLELTKYEMQVANVCTGTPGNFTPLYYFTTPTVTYCAMSSTVSGTEYINKVTVTPYQGTAFVNTTTGAPYTYYPTNLDGKELVLVQGTQGNVIKVDKTSSSGTNTGVAVWIDFNRNGYFDVNEKIMSNGPNNADTASAAFTVPDDAFVSMTDYKYVVMRVAMQKDGIPVNCTNFQNGEVEDYKVRIVKQAVVNPLNQTDIMIYPNPVSTILNVKNISKKANYKIYSSAGQLVSDGLILNNKIDVSRLINGLYVIELVDGDKTVQKKFIKE